MAAINFDQPSKGQVSSTETALDVVNTGDGEGIRATTYSNDQAAVVGVSEGNAPAGFFLGNVEVSGDIRLPNADCAEEFDVYESTEIEPGTVMVLSNDGKLAQSNTAYDKKVAGVVSGGGSHKAAIVLDRQQSQNSSSRLPVALMGKAYCKVDARYSSIEIGVC